MLLAGAIGKRAHNLAGIVDAVQGRVLRAGDVNLCKGPLVEEEPVSAGSIGQESDNLAGIIDAVSPCELSVPDLSDDAVLVKEARQKGPKGITIRSNNLMRIVNVKRFVAARADRDAQRSELAVALQEREGLEG